MTDTDYEIDIRSIDTDYTTTLPRDVGEQIDAKTTVSLSTITVTVALKWDRRREQQSETLEVPFTVDHGDETVRAKSVGDAYGEVESLSVERLLVALTAAEQAVARLLDGLPTGLILRPIEERWPLGEVTEEPVDVIHDEQSFAAEGVLLEDVE